MGAPSNRPTADQGDAGVQPWPIKIDQTTPGTTNAVAPIAGQAGVDGGAGATTAKTVRTVSATDDGVVTGLGAQADVVASSDAGTFSLISLFKRLLGKFTTQFPAALAAGGGLKVEGVVGGVALPVSGVISVTEAEGTSIAAGKAFTASPAAVVSVGIGASYDVLIITPASPVTRLYDVLVNANFPVLPSSGYADITLYEASTTSADGAAITVYNNKRNSGTALSSTVHTAPTVTTIGTAIARTLVNVNRETFLSPSRTSNFAIILKPSEKYILRINNGTNKALDYAWWLFFTEE